MFRSRHKLALHRFVLRLTKKTFRSRSKKKKKKKKRTQWQSETHAMGDASEDDSSEDLSEEEIRPLLILSDNKTTQLLLMTDHDGEEEEEEEEGEGMEEVEEEEGMSERVDIEEGFALSGGCGVYQYQLQLMFSYLVVCIASASFVPYFVLDDPPWKCTPNSTAEFCTTINNNINKSNKTITYNINNNNKSLYNSQYISSDNPDFNQRCSMKRTDWEFTTPPGYSAVTDFDLVCGYAKWAELTNAMHYAGGVVGSIVCGKGADAWGRRVVLVACLLMHVVTSFGCAFVWRVWQLVLLRTLNGASVLPCYNIAAVYLMEFVPTSHRYVCWSIYTASCRNVKSLLRSMS